MKKGMILGLMLLLVLAVSSPAGAVITINDWTFNLGGIDGIAAGTQVQNVSEITYVGLVHNHNYDTNANGKGDVGELGQSDGLLAATSFLDTNGQIIFGTGLNSTYQLTFGFTVDTKITAIDPVTGDVSFIHLAPTVPGTHTAGIIEVFVDGPTGGVTVANQSTGDNYLDGQPVAIFEVLTGDGGVFHPATFDGSDDATFVLLAALPGVILDHNGNDIAIAGGLLALTDSNTDGDPTHNPNIGFTITTPSAWPFALNGAGTINDNFEEEDGSARLAPVPEPSTIVLLAMGLLGLGAVGRKRTKK